MCLSAECIFVSGCRTAETAMDSKMVTSSVVNRPVDPRLLTA
jgi:hypothetical protein